jgi:UDP-N-acetylmuramate--alanine ligase
MTPSPIVSRPISAAGRGQPRPRNAIRSAHLVGIGGAGMKALTELAVGLGWRVSGSDIQRTSPTIDAMKRRGLRVHCGHQERYLAADVDVLIYSPAVPAENPERQQAARLGIPQMSCSQMLGHLMQDRTGVCIAGTHGKSTTTAMTACILAGAGLRPSAVIGAELCGSGASGWAGQGRLLVVESCEYMRSFLDLQPVHAAILGIEPDHFDCFHDSTEMQAAFAQFAAKVGSDGTLLVRGDCAAVIAACKSAAAPVETFSLAPDADWWAADIRRVGSGMRFRIFRRGDFFTEITLQIPGIHNVLNALAAAAISHSAGAGSYDIRESLREFPGIRRRFERIGSWRGVTLIDDYAHHPTAVRATLEAAREEFGARRIWGVFQPHQVSRTRALFDEFAGAFAAADRILIAPIYAARENTSLETRTLADELAARIRARGGDARFYPCLDQIIRTLDHESEPGDVLVTMGAGDVNRVQHEFTRRLQRHHSAG